MKIAGSKHKRRGVFWISVFSALALAGCDIPGLLDNSPMDYIDEHLGTVLVTGWEGRGDGGPVPVQRPDGIVAIPPGNSIIAVKLRNLRDHTIVPSPANTGSAGTFTAHQENSSTIVVRIAGAAHGDEYNLSLGMKSSDGKEFPRYDLPKLKCYYFDTSLYDLSVKRRDGMFFTSLLAFSAATTAYTATIEYGI
ncbi:MAG: hypothetical protein LBT33_10190, partial [Spirochaetia bacterium]|nr:hypothetical protein [Spirochaetia bacterium]